MWRRQDTEILNQLIQISHTWRLTLNIPSLGRQRCLPSWDPRTTPMIFFVISQLFDEADYSNYVFWVSETVIQ